MIILRGWTCEDQFPVALRLSPWLPTPVLSIMTRSTRHRSGPEQGWASWAACFVTAVTWDFEATADAAACRAACRAAARLARPRQSANLQSKVRGSPQPSGPGPVQSWRCCLAKGPATSPWREITCNATIQTTTLDPVSIITTFLHVSGMWQQVVCE